MRRKLKPTQWNTSPRDPGRDFLEHPLLRGGFLDGVYECFKDQNLAEKFMIGISDNIESFTPLHAQRCAMSGWVSRNTV